VLSPETSTFLEGGCATVVGTVSTDGAPWATRGWGLVVTDRAGGELRLLLDADDEQTLANLNATGVIAITGADPATARSTQVKGLATGIETANDADVLRCGQYCDAFFGIVEQVDCTPRTQLDRLVPARFFACRMEIHETYDQSPGPIAGRALHGRAE
jgi:hypothetical protein